MPTEVTVCETYYSCVRGAVVILQWYKSSPKAVVVGTIKTVGRTRRASHWRKGNYSLARHVSQLRPAAPLLPER